MDGDGDGNDVVDDDDDDDDEDDITHCTSESPRSLKAYTYTCSNPNTARRFQLPQPKPRSYTAQLRTALSKHPWRSWRSSAGESSKGVECRGCTGLIV